jgi:hypothetical protein
MCKVRWVGVVVVALLPLAVVAAPKDSKESSPGKKGPALQKGKDLPGPFHPYNVNGPQSRHYHCPVSDRGLEPLVLVFVRNLDVTDPLRDLLKRLDQASEKNPKARLGSAAVFFTDDLSEVVGADDKSDDQRDKLIEKLTDLDGSLKKPSHVTLCLTAPADLKAYQLPDDAEVTVVLCDRYKVVGLHVLTRDQLTGKRVDAILSEVADNLVAPRQGQKAPKKD